MKTGIDLVKVSDLKQRLGGDLSKVFSDSELKYKEEKLAGVFALKEAFFKALGRKDDWLSVFVTHEDSGKPKVISTLLPENQQIDASVSYAGEYVVAVVIII